MYQEVALSDAAAYLALPRTWGLTSPQGSVGGAHAGYRVYPCKDGRVAVAALEPDTQNSYFANRLVDDLSHTARVMATPALVFEEID